MLNTQESTIAPSPLDLILVGPGAVDPLHIPRRSTRGPRPLEDTSGAWVT